MAIDCTKFGGTILALVGLLGSFVSIFLHGLSSITVGPLTGEFLDSK